MISFFINKHTHTLTHSLGQCNFPKNNTLPAIAALTKQTRRANNNTEK